MKNVTHIHEGLIKKYCFPDWLIQYQCDQCKEKIGEISIRSVGIKINAQHIGNFFAEICCQHCKCGYEIHIRNVCKNIEDFTNLLKNNTVSHKIETDYSMSYSDSNITKNVLEEVYGNKETQQNQ